MLKRSGDIPESVYQKTEQLLGALKRVDESTFHHCLRVGEYARLLAKSAGLNEYEQKVAQFSGLLHDIGKQNISADVVHKPGKLTDDEYTQMKEHSTLSETLLKPMADHEFWQQVLPAVRGHHERVDGTGYPDNLNGDQIPLAARLILVVDTLDAMAETRVYRKGLPIDVIYKEIRRCSGSQFDMQLARIFLESHSTWKSENLDQETLLRVAPPERLIKSA
jgi:putative nucleotidyltransferase with HDIG domain